MRPIETNGSIYSISMNNIYGEALHFSKYSGKYLLIVNVASKCGFTPQYKELEELYQKFNDKLMVVGVPCNQFAGQEPGGAMEIQTFCERNYGVTFDLTEKANVKGPNQHELYRWLTQKTQNKNKNSKVRWNFQKYLISPTGGLIDYYYSITSPLSQKIIKNIV